MAQQVIVSPSPHIHSGDTISKNMYGVLIALIPAFLVMLYQFRTDALLITAISVASCMLTEWVITRFFLHRPCRLLDGSALLTGVILAFNLPPLVARPHGWCRRHRHWQDGFWRTGQ